MNEQTHMYMQVSRNNIDDCLEKYDVVVCRLRSSRVKAKQLAVMELFMALRPPGGVFLANGPLGDIKGLLCYMIPRPRVGMLQDILSGIGYCDKFYLLDFNGDMRNESDLVSINERMWKGRRFGIRVLLEQDRRVYEAQSSHNRPFMIAGGDGTARGVTGYRGDGTPLGRRALPVEDCRCLVNLAIPCMTRSLIDPFAGAGGIVYAARYINADARVTTVDIDPALAPGLEMYGASHHVGNAARIALTGKYDAVVTELPFAPEATGEALAGLNSIGGYLESDGRVSVMCASHQFDAVCQSVRDMGMHIYCAHIVNRKGTDVAIVAATRDRRMAECLSPLIERVATIY